MAADVPRGTSSAASRQSSSDGSDGSAKNDATSAGYRRARRQTCANRACAPDRAAYTGLSRRASSLEDIPRSISVVLNRARSLEVLEQDRFDVEDQLDFVTDDHAAAGNLILPGDAEVVAVELGRRLETDPT
jgi:hypothetical protein